MGMVGGCDSNKPSRVWNEPLLRDKVLNLPIEARSSYF